MGITILREKAEPQSLQVYLARQRFFQDRFPQNTLGNAV